MQYIHICCCSFSSGTEDDFPVPPTKTVAYAMEEYFFPRNGPSYRVPDVLSRTGDVISEGLQMAFDHFKLIRELINLNIHLKLNIST